MTQKRGRPPKRTTRAADQREERYAHGKTPRRPPPPNRVDFPAWIPTDHVPQDREDADQETIEWLAKHGLLSWQELERWLPDEAHLYRQPRGPLSREMLYAKWTLQRWWKRIWNRPES